MRAGELDRLIVIQAGAPARGSNGEATYTWSTFATVWASYKPLRGQEYLAAQQVNAEIEAVFRIRWLASLTTAHRISWDGRLWDIQGINEIGRREGLELMAKVHRL